MADDYLGWHSFETKELSWRLERDGRVFELMDEWRAQGMSASEAMRYLPGNIRDWVFGEYKEITANYRLMGPMIRNPSPFGSGPRSDVFNADIDYGELAEFFIANYYETGRWPEQWPPSPGWAKEWDERQKRFKSKPKVSSKKAPAKSSNRKVLAGKPARAAPRRR